MCVNYVGQSVNTTVDYFIILFRNSNGSLKLFKKQFREDAVFNDMLNPDTTDMELEVMFQLIHRTIKTEFHLLITPDMVDMYRNDNTFYKS